MSKQNGHLFIKVKCLGCDYRQETQSRAQPFCPFWGSPLIATGTVIRKHAAARKGEDEQAMVK